MLNTSEVDLIQTQCLPWLGIETAGKTLGLLSLEPLCGAGVRVAVRFPEGSWASCEMVCVQPSTGPGMYLRTCDCYCFIQLFLVKSPVPSRRKNLFK